MRWRRGRLARRWNAESSASSRCGGASMVPASPLVDAGTPPGVNLATSATPCFAYDDAARGGRRSTERLGHEGAASPSLGAGNRGGGGRLRRDGAPAVRRRWTRARRCGHSTPAEPVRGAVRRGGGGRGGGRGGGGSRLSPLRRVPCSARARATARCAGRSKPRCTGTRRPRPTWRARRRGAAATARVVCVGAVDGSLHAFAASDGRAVACERLPGAKFSSPVLCASRALVDRQDDHSTIAELMTS